MPSPVHSTQIAPIGPPLGGTTARGITRPIQPASRSASTNTTPCAGSLTRTSGRASAQRERAVAAELHDGQLAAQAGHVAALPAQRGLEREHEVLAQVEDVVVEDRPRGTLAFAGDGDQVAVARDGVQRRAAVVEPLLGLVAARAPRRELVLEIAAGDVHALEAASSPARRRG